jgi:hypothetical protein
MTRRRTQTDQVPDLGFVDLGTALITEEKAAAAERAKLEAEVAVRLKNRWKEIESKVPTLNERRVSEAACWLAGLTVSINHKPNNMLPGAAAEQLKGISAKIDSLIAEIRAADYPLQRELLRFIGTLNQYGEYCFLRREEFIAKIDKKNPKKPRETQKKLAAVGASFHLLQGAGVKPTISAEGAWPYLSQQLFYLAFSYDHGEMYRSCSAWMKQHRHSHQRFVR